MIIKMRFRCLILIVYNGRCFYEVFGAGGGPLVVFGE